jgi:hypothetical protein
MKNSFIGFFCWLFVSGGLTALAQGVETLTFNDLPDPGMYGSPVPAGYGGFQWDNFSYLDGADFIASGYQNGAVSGGNVAFNGIGGSALFNGGGVFDLDSAWLTAAWNDGLNVEVQGFAGASLIYDNTYVLNATAPTLINFNYLQVDSVEFISSGGVNYGSDGSGTEFVMDNLTVDVPEPDTFGLLIFGAAVAGLVGLGKRFTNRSQYLYGSSY